MRRPERSSAALDQTQASIVLSRNIDRRSSQEKNASKV
jgi:hypothetical protein